MAYRGVKRIISQDHHRNGSGGAPFVVTVFEPADQRGRFVAMSFGSTFDEFREHTGVVNLSLLPDVEFAHGNSWRGADHYGPDIARAWQEKCKSGQSHGGDGGLLSRYDPFDGSWDPESAENAAP